MKTTKVLVNFGMTYNLGNYQSMRIDVGEEIEIKDESPEKVIKERFLQLKQLVEDELHYAEE